MDIRSLGFRTDLRILQMTGTEIEDRGTHLVVRTPANPTYFWGNYLLLKAMPFLGGEREVIGAFHTEFPQAEHVAIGIDGPDDRTGTLDAFVEAGLEFNNGVVLTAAALVEPAAVPEGIVVRALESDEDWEQRARLSHRLFAQGTDDATFMACARTRNEQERGLVTRGIGARYGAFAADELVSTAGIYLTHAGVARFHTVATDTTYRHQGLAAAVVHDAGQHAVEQLQVQRLVILADHGGDAIGVYRRLGFVESEFHTILERRPDSAGDHA